MKKLFLLFSLAVGFIACEADEIFDLNQEVVALSDQLDQETKDRIAADAENFETLQALINEVVENQAVINEAFEAADAALAEAIAAEEAAREAGDLAQAEALAAETAARQQDVADLEAEIAEQVTKLTGLIVTNANAIVALDNALTAEKEARIAQDSILTAKVKTNLSFILSNARAISQEVADRKAAIADLQSQLDKAKEELQAAIDANAENITELQNAVKSLESQVAVNVDAIDVAEERLRKIEIEMMWAAEALDGIDGVDDHQVVEDDEWKQAHLLLSEGIREVIEAVQEAQANIISNDTDILNLQDDVAVLSGQVSNLLSDYVSGEDLNNAIANFITLEEANNAIAAQVSETLAAAKAYADENDDVLTDEYINGLIQDVVDELVINDVDGLQAALDNLQNAINAVEAVEGVDANKLKIISFSANSGILNGVVLKVFSGLNQFEIGDYIRINGEVTAYYYADGKVALTQGHDLDFNYFNNKIMIAYKLDSDSVEFDSKVNYSITITGTGVTTTTFNYEANTWDHGLVGETKNLNDILLDDYQIKESISGDVDVLNAPDVEISINNYGDALLFVNKDLDDNDHLVDVETTYDISDIVELDYESIIDEAWESVSYNVSAISTEDTDYCKFRYVTLYGEGFPEGTEIELDHIKYSKPGKSTGYSLNDNEYSWLDEDEDGNIDGISFMYDTNASDDNHCWDTDYFMVSDQSTIELTFVVSVGGDNYTKKISGIDLTDTSNNQLNSTPKLIVKRPQS